MNDKMIPLSQLLDFAKTLTGRIDELEEKLSLAQDLIAGLNKASQDWLDGEPRRLTELADLKSDISRLESQIRSSQGGSSVD